MDKQNDKVKRIKYVMASQISIWEFGVNVNYLSSGFKRPYL